MAERTKGHRGSAAGDRLTQAAWHIFALAKLRMYPSAAEELAALGPLDVPLQHDGETAQGAATGATEGVCSKCSMHRDGRTGHAGRVPFALRWLHAQLPTLLGRPRRAGSSCTACWSSAAGRRAALRHPPLPLVRGTAGPLLDSSLTCSAREHAG